MVMRKIKGIGESEMNKRCFKKFFHIINREH